MWLMRIGTRALRGDADHAVAERDLRAHAGGAVATAGHGVQALAAASTISSIAWLMPNSWASSARVRSNRPPRSAQSASALLRRRRASSRLRGPRRPVAGFAARRGYEVDLIDLVEVSTAQLEHPAHPGVRGDAGKLGLHALEQRAIGFGAQVTGADAVHRAMRRVDHQPADRRVGEHVVAGSC